MKLKAILAGTAIATMALAGAPQLGAPTFTTRAEAAVDVSINLFYDRLASQGDWVSYRDQYVFIPARVGDDWRPYTLGHWVYAKRYGWTWVSDEPFGWATYHYGRWGYAEDIGWYWVPGRRWAPAWVSWRRSNDYVVWAPLPPSRGGDIDISINIEVGDIPDYYWVAVPTRRFLEPDLRVVVINDDRKIRQVVERTEYIGTPRITNNIVVNNVIDVDVISQETGQQVRTVEVKTTEDPAAAKATSDQVTVFQGEIAADTKAKPPKLVDISKARKVKRKDAADAVAPEATPPADGSATTTAPADQPATGDAATAPAGGLKKEKKVDTGSTATTPDDATSGEASAPAATGEQPTGKKKKQQNEDASAPAGQQPVQADEQSTGKKKKKKQQNENASAPAASEEQPVQAEDQSTGKKKKAKQQGGEESTGSTTAAPSPAEEGTGANAPNQQKKGKGKKDQACDPATDADCVPAQ